jgi:hypothetical protein
VADLLSEAIAGCPLGPDEPLRVRVRVELGPKEGRAVLDAADPVSAAWARCVSAQLEGVSWPTVEAPAVVRRELRRGG